MKESLIAWLDWLLSHMAQLLVVFGLSPDLAGPALYFTPGLLGILIYRFLAKGRISFSGDDEERCCFWAMILFAPVALFVAIYAIFDRPKKIDIKDASPRKTLWSRFQ